MGELTHLQIHSKYLWNHPIMISVAIIVSVAMGILAQSPEAPFYAAEQIFTPVEPQTHAPSIVEMANGDLLASWYGDAVVGIEGGSDAAIFGARKRKGAANWGKPFLLADTPGFPDCNTSMMIDKAGTLWLFWPTIIAGSWESSLMKYRRSTDYLASEQPKWDKEGLILLKPDDFGPEALKILGDRKIKPPRGVKATPEQQIAKLSDSFYQRMGWANRCKPTVLANGRILLPLYSDTYSISIMAISDDAGANWFASKPLIGFGNIQPTVLQRKDGSLVAYMREHGPLNAIRVAESTDNGMTWGVVGKSDLPNPGSGIDAVKLSNGHWALIFNNEKNSRATLSIAISEDEGRSWKQIRKLEDHKAGRYHYPAIIQGHDGLIHVIYSTFIAPEDGDETAKAKNQTLKGIKHATLNEAWIKAGH